MRTVKLNNGVEMPILGLGVFQIADQSECQRTVEEALAVGYRLIDTAASYQNERAVGKAIQASGVPRNELFVTTKLWVQDAGYDSAKAAFARSAEKLGLDYLDLYLIHQPYGDLFGTWRALQELNRDGSIRAIGVSNFHTDRLMDLMVHHEIPPAINQVETHPFHQQNEMNRFLVENNIQHQSWGPFAEGKNNIFGNELLLSLARKHSKSVAQVILRWLVQRDVVVIPKSSRKERLVENMDVFDFQLSDEDMQAIAPLDTAVSSFFDHRDPKMVKWLGERRLDS